MEYTLRPTLCETGCVCVCVCVFPGYLPVPRPSQGGLAAAAPEEKSAVFQAGSPPIYSRDARRR